MCGIAGSLMGGAAVDEDVLRMMASRLSHRGPDDCGVWSDSAAGIGLAHARLSVVDLSEAGHQPMQSASGRFVMVFNGEVYNHAVLREELGTAAHGWRGHSDTETLLAAIESWGVEGAIQRAVGMFAFALWDRRDQLLILGRDRFGEKPLYYGWQDDVFLFGSELKALAAHPAFQGAVDRDALASYLRLGYVPAPQSIYRDIHKLTPGTLLSIDRNRQSEHVPRPYWSSLEVAVHGQANPFIGSDKEAIDELESRLSEAVTMQCVADVPLGAFLSGGIDSSLIVALMQRRSSRPVRSFTIGFDDPRYDEAEHGRAVATCLGTDHVELRVTSREARDVVPRLPEIYDEPFADSSQIPTFLVSKLARSRVTVSLSGDAGDELFGGYNRYAWLGRIMKLSPALRRLAARAINTQSPARWDRIYEALRPLLPSSLRVRQAGDKAHKLASLLAEQTDEGCFQRVISAWDNPEDVVIGGHDRSHVRGLWAAFAGIDGIEARMMALDAVTYLPDDILCKVDRAAMAVSLETRVPFLDHRVVELAWRLPMNMKIREGHSKWILRQLLYRHVPKAVIDRPKTGFGVPLDEWLRGPLRDWAEALLNERRLAQEGYFNPGPIRTAWAEHLSGRRNWQHQLWNVLMFQAWLDAGT